MTGTVAPEGYPGVWEGASRWELLRALGWLSASQPGDAKQLSLLLDLEPWSPAEHTRLFILDLPPYSSIYLGAEGKLGGEAADRAAGFWRALGLEVPAQPDHLAHLLGLYASLGQAAADSTGRARERLSHARAALLGEHLLPWLPMYLASVASYPAGRPWAVLTLSALWREAKLPGPSAGLLPAALRHAPPPINAGTGYEELLDALTTPIRAGFILTNADLLRCGQEVGVGARRAERRFTLGAMLCQDPPGVLQWLAQHAHLQAATHDTWGSNSLAAKWWGDRARATAGLLKDLALDAG